MRIDEYLFKSAERFPEKVFVICGDKSITYADFCAKVEKEATHYQPRKLIVFRASQTIDFLITFFAILKADAIAVPFECSIPDDVLRNYEQSLAQTAVERDVAIVLYTTGTTGKSKGVMISHRAIEASAQNLVFGQRYDSDITFVINGPLNHIGSLSKVWPIVMNGGSLYVLEDLKSMDELFKALELSNTKVATFMVPAGLRMLMQFGSDRLSAYKNKIDFIETGAAPISKSDMERLHALLPETRLYNTYASTETGVVSTYEFSKYGCVEGCLGKPLPNSSINITESGLISVTGDSIMTGYINDEDLTSTTLRDNAIFTSDCGYIDDLERLNLKGRNDDVINVGGYKVAPTEIENLVLAIDGIENCICIPDTHPILGTIVKLLYKCAEGCTITPKEIASYLGTKVEKYKVPQAYAAVSSIKRTYNGKLDRKYYISK